MWLDKPPLDEKLALTPLLRPKSGGQLCVELVGPPLRVFVHYAAGRSWPCTDFSCTLCKRQIAKRFYAYYPVRGGRGGLAILELTGLAENQLTKQMDPFSHEPCGMVTVSRPPGRKNLPCTVTWKEPDGHRKSGCGELSESGLKKCLMRIWNLPGMNGEEDEKKYLAKLNEIIRLKTMERE